MNKMFSQDQNFTFIKIARNKFNKCFYFYAHLTTNNITSPRLQAPHLPSHRGECSAYGL